MHDLGIIFAPSRVTYTVYVCWTRKRLRPTPRAPTSLRPSTYFPGPGGLWKVTNTRAICKQIFLQRVRVRRYENNGVQYNLIEYTILEQGS